MFEREIENFMFNIVDNLPPWIKKAAWDKNSNLQIGLLISTELTFKDNYSNYQYSDVDIIENNN